MRYTYDTLNRLHTVKDVVDNKVLVEYSYDQNGNRASLTYAGGTSERYEYNAANLVTKVENRSGGNTLSEFSYIYYLDGNQESKRDYGTRGRFSRVYCIRLSADEKSVVPIPV